MSEKAYLFGRFHTLVGVLTEPENPAPNRPAVILCNAGLMHRIGPNRIYVKLARALAEQGFWVFRFDLSGVGDSLPRPDNMGVEDFTIDDVVQAMDHLSAQTGCQQFVVGGHCAGAYHSIRAAAHSPRVCGVVMINPDGGEADWKEYDKRRKLAQFYENYYGKKTLTDAGRWKRFFTFQVNYGKILRNVFQNVIWNRVSGFFFRARRRLAQPQTTPADDKLYTVESILRKMPEIPARVLMVYSENSTGLERVQTGMSKEIRQLHAAGKLDLAVIEGADHLFSPLATQASLFQSITRWMEETYPAG